MTTRLAGALVAGSLAVGLLAGAAGMIVGRDIAASPGSVTGAFTDIGRMDGGSMMGGGMGGGSMRGMMGADGMAGMMDGSGMSPELHRSHHVSPSQSPTP